MRLIKKGWKKGIEFFVYVVKDIREIKVDYACYVCPKCGCWGDLEAVKNLDIHISFDNKVFMKRSDTEHFTFRCRSCSFWDVIDKNKAYHFVVGFTEENGKLKIYFDNVFYKYLDKDCLDYLVNSVYLFLDDPEFI